MIDLRNDTCSRPIPEMRQMIANANANADVGADEAPALAANGRSC